MKNIISLWILCALVSAQTIDVNALRAIGQSNTSKLGLNRTKLTQEIQDQSHIILDRPVDQNIYLVGPGDQFRVNIISSIEVFNYLLTVTPTGEILIPAVSIVPVYGLTLKQAKISMEKTVKGWNQNAKIYITLEQIRKFKVKVVGQIKTPGLYDVTPMTRISDLYQIIIEDNYSNETENKQLNKELGKIEKDQLTVFEQNSQIEDLYERKIGSIEKDKEFQEISRRNLILIRNQDSINIDLRSCIDRPMSLVLSA